jgi:AAA+ superfamily predicted ATPase
MSQTLPPWAQEMRDLFKSGSVSQFILHGAVLDVVPSPAGDNRMLSLGTFLDEVMFKNFDVVLHYNRGRGISAVKGAEDWGDWLQQWGGQEGGPAALREPGRALDTIDRYLLRTLHLRTLKNAKPPERIAVVVEFADFVVPRGDPLYLGSEFSAGIIKVLGWANDPAILQCNIATVLMVEGLADISPLVAQNPHSAKLKIPLPDEAEMLEYVKALAAAQFPDLQARCEVPLDVLARRLTGLSRVGARTVLALALNNQKSITAAWLTKMKKEMIERECQGLLEFLESPFTLDHVAGHDAVKAWLREDTQLLRKGALHALPMGYLVAGRIGTGKTFLVMCWAGELGIPCVVLKNFRDKWVGATESNLEKIFSVLRALGQAVVFVDEADQMAGKREGGDGDSGLSGRVYGMLAKEMSDTRNRGRILWVFATSRPDLLEVDLKRQGRLDVHIPLFPPETLEEMKALMLAIAKKYKFPLAETDLVDVPKGTFLGGNEIEGVLVRALRIYELQGDAQKPLKDILTGVFKEVRPNAYTQKLEYMDYIAVKECTDAKFLPERFRELSPDELERRIAERRKFV